MFGLNKNVYCIIKRLHNRRFWRVISSLCENKIKCLTLNNWLCHARPRLVNINSDETLFYQFTVSVNKCGGSCNNIDNPYAWIRVPNKIKNVNVKVINWWSRVHLST